jgi:hypothetical protein
MALTILSIFLGLLVLLWTPLIYWLKKAPTVSE